MYLRGSLSGLTVRTSSGASPCGGYCPGRARVEEWCYTTSDEGSEQLINNRQNGRRRGRGGVRPPNGANNLERGSRLDNRARGNASQLHEKYKTLARDAQMQSDRVMTEYYLQFADHYFRVLSESRSRLDEQQQQRRERYDGPEYDEEDGEGDAAEDRVDEQPRGASGDNNRGSAPRYNEGERDGRREQRQPRQEREPREARQEREPRPEREPRQEREPRSDREPRQNANVVEERAPRPPRSEAPRAEAPRDELPLGDVAEVVRRPRGRRPRVQAEESVEPAKEERIEIDRLPPAFAAEPASDEPEEKPRRRTRRVARPATDPATVDA